MSSASSFQNLVMITLDCVRPDFLGCYGNTRVRTPNIDRLASRGAVFEQAVSQAPCTWVSHAGIFTGTFPPTHGLRSPFGVLSPRVPTLAEVLSEAGFKTSGFPANELVGSRTGLGRGFNFYYEDFKGERTTGPTANRRNSWSDTLSAASERFSIQKGERFFSWFHYLDTHHLPECDLPEYYRTEFRQDWQFYEGKISYADENCVGRVLSLLEEQGLHRDTLVVVFADHGETLGGDGCPRANERMRDTVRRVPLIFSSPGGKGTAGRIARQARTVDIMPTILDLLKIPRPRWPRMDGKNLFEPEIPTNHNTSLAYAENFPQGMASIRTEEWKLVRKNDGKFLFHLPTDSRETKNVWEKNPLTGRFLDKELEKILRGIPDFSLGLSIKNEFPPPPPSTPQNHEDTIAALRGLGYL